MQTVKGKVQKILFLGDMLIDFGDFLYCNKALPPSGYVEEWWAKDLQNAIQEKYGSDYQKAAQAANLPLEKIESFVLDPFVKQTNSQRSCCIEFMFRHPTCSQLYIILGQSLKRARGRVAETVVNNL